MKIIHCADLHIDSKMETNFTREQAKIRKEEILKTYENMVKYAVDNHVRVIIIAGDLFDKSNVGKRAKNRVIEQIINNPQIDFLYLRGNHDNVELKENFSDTRGSEEYIEGQDEELKNLKIFNNEGWTSYNYENVVITGIEIDRENNGKIYDKLILEPSKVNIVTLHGQETVYKSDKTEVINITELKNKYIDYLALGHIHQYKRERLDERGIYCYSGCLEGRGFDECGRKGFVLLDIDNNEIKDTFIPFANREFHEVKVDISDITGVTATGDIISKIKETMKAIPDKDCVKFILKGEVELDDDIDTERILNECGDKFYFSKLYNEIKVRIDYKTYANDRSLKGEFVRMLEAEDMEEDEKLRIIEIGLKALRGEEIEV